MHLLALLCCAVAFAQPDILSLPARLSFFPGAELADLSGRRLGQVEDVVLDLANARMRYAILEVAGRRLAYPFARLERSLDGGHVLIHETAARLAAAPALAERRGSPAWWAYWAGASRPALIRASELLRRRVDAPDGSAELADVVIDAHEGEVAFAVVRFERRLHPVPLRLFALEGDSVRLDLALAKLDPRHDLSLRELKAVRDEPVRMRTITAYAASLAPK